MKLVTARRSNSCIKWERITSVLLCKVASVWHLLLKHNKMMLSSIVCIIRILCDTTHEVNEKIKIVMRHISSKGTAYKCMI